MSDERWMSRALALAERVRGATSPNPAVGCVIVRGGEVVGEGATSPPGGPHAEVVALRTAGERARGATAYVTLEPCDHRGRTGPCSLALIEAGVDRVVAATSDPDPRAAGGARRLRSAGVVVDTGIAEDEARAQNAAFFHSRETGLPLVTVKLAVSLDGRIAAADGTSQWLTGEDARRSAHRLRAGCDAVLVGSQTVLDDDPRLTVRTGPAPAAQPLRVVLDARARTSPDHRVYDDEAPSLAVVASGVDASQLTDAGVEVWRRDTDREGGGELRALLAELDRREVTSVLVEGGAQVAGAFVAADLADRLVVHMAPVLLGSGGVPALSFSVSTLADAPRWRLEHVEAVGGDIVLCCAGRDRERA